MTRFWHGLTLLGYFGLFAVLCLWLLAQPGPLRLLLSLVLLGPLLPPLRGLIYGRSRTHLGVSLLAMVYFCVGIALLAGDLSNGDPAWMSGLIVLSSLLLFGGALSYVRSRTAPS